MNLLQQARERAVPVATPTDRVVPLYQRNSEEIRQQAYEIYVQR